MIIRDKGGIRQGNPFVVMVINICKVYIYNHINVSQLSVALRKAVALFSFNVPPNITGTIHAFLSW